MVSQLPSLALRKFNSGWNKGILENVHLSGTSEFPGPASSVNRWGNGGSARGSDLLWCGISVLKGFNRTMTPP